MNCMHSLLCLLSVLLLFVFRKRTCFQKGLHQMQGKAGLAFFSILFIRKDDLFGSRKVFIFLDNVVVAKVNFGLTVDDEISTSG